jgi:hypothetical protein
MTITTPTTSVFAKFVPKAFPYQFTGQLHVDQIVGGIPSDPKVAEGWLRSKLAESDDLIREQIAKTMIERDVDAEQAAELVDSLRHLNGFKRDENGLYIEGRQLKACLKEASMIAANAGKLRAGKWGNPTDANYKKGLKAWIPEHVFVQEDRLYLGVDEPSRINQRFAHTQRGTGIVYEEIVDDAVIDFTVATDYKFKDEEWAMIWLTAEQNGLGATRSQGYGRFTVVRWEAL